MNLGYLLEQTYAALGFTKIKSVATGGSATTIVDTSLATLYGTNAFKKHIFFISQTTDGASPQGKFGILPASHYVSSSQTFTIPTVTATVDAGDVYSIMKPTVGLYDMINQINLGLGMLPPVRLPNTSLTVTAGASVYSIPIAAAHYPIQEVWIGNDTKGWSKYTNWQISPNTAGNTPSLIFYERDFITVAQNAFLNGMANVGDTIKLIYLGKQTTLSTYSDAISEQYPDELVLSCCFYTALEYYMKLKGLMINRRWTPILQGAEKRYQTAKIENPIRIPPAPRTRTIELGRMP